MQYIQRQRGGKPLRLSKRDTRRAFESLIVDQKLNPVALLVEIAMEARTSGDPAFADVIAQMLLIGALKSAGEAIAA